MSSLNTSVIINLNFVAAYVGYLKYPNNKPLPTLATTECNWGDGSTPVQRGNVFQN
jgi:hypothetical protein